MSIRYGAHLAELVCPTCYDSHHSIGELVKVESNNGWSVYICSLCGSNFRHARIDA